MHFFSPANVMKLLEVVRGEKTAKDVLATVMQLGKKIKQDRRRLGRLRRLHRQPHARAVPAPGDVPARGRRVAAAGRPRAREVRHGDGAVPHGRPRRQRRRLGDPQAPLRREAGRASTRGSPTGCASWAASARRPAPAGTATKPGERDAHSRSRGRRDDRRRIARSAASRRARSATRRSSSAASTRWSTRARASSRRASRCAPRDIDVVYLTGYGFPLYRGGPMFYADTVGLFNVVRTHAALRRQSARRSGVLEAGAAARAARRRRQDVQRLMPSRAPP